MLVLRRKPGQAIVINPGPNQVRVALEQTESGKLMFQIEAPAEVVVLREEVLQRQEVANEHGS